MTGNDYRDLIAEYLVGRYHGKGLAVYKEVTVGRSVIGKRRRVDVLVTANGKMVALEAKYQSTSGTAEEKLTHAIVDAESMPMPCGIVYAGSGWSDGALWLLRRKALYFDQIKNDTTELDCFLAIHLEWPEILLGRYTPVPMPIPIPRETTRTD